MKFNDMLKKTDLEILESYPVPDFAVNKLCYNSKSVAAGDVFFAIKGLKSDGNEYIDEAISRGANAVFSDRVKDIDSKPIYKVADCRKAMAVLSNVYFGYPSLKMKLIGVTGTNGKTTVTHLINHILEHAGKKTGLIGTNGNVINKRVIETSFTTPESIDLNKILSEMYENGAEYVTMEVSSHSLAMKRVFGLEFDTAIFTNLTPEHLDFHENMESYLGAKKILFDSMKRINSKGYRTTVIYNSDDEYGKRIINDTESERISYGLKSALYSVENLKMSFEGMSFDMMVPMNGEGTKKFHFDTKLTGKFNVYNILASGAALKTENIPFDLIQDAVKGFEPVDGRFNQVKLGNGAVAIIDYSHTPDSLLKAIETIREILISTDTKGEIITVFGCGGNRDKLKRSKMGEIATRLSDRVIITSDNPRDEDPNVIIEQIEKGTVNKNYQIEENREKAIEATIKSSKSGDIILIAGKGHESYQEIKGVRYHLNDKEIASRFI
jgi:UDP-N-acetylmuramoyl-L-alanyl-D-glutamate--2,6-diaminopimelate ligase